jgi:hypothetical protein
MIARGTWIVVAGLFLASGSPRSDAGPTGAAGLLPTGILPIENTSSLALSAALRSYLVKAVPSIDYEKKSGWGTTTRVLTGVKLKDGKGRYAEKNTGTWKKTRVTSPALAQTLVLVLKDIKEQAPGTFTFSLDLAFPARIDYTQQKWASGVRLYEAIVRARMEVAFALRCEVSVRLEAGKGLFPDAVVHLRVLGSDLKYNKLVVEHVAGLGGAAAKVMGGVILAGIKKRHPSLERHLLEKANAAIVKAGNNKEVRIGLDKVMKMKMKK